MENGIASLGANSLLSTNRNTGVEQANNPTNSVNQLRAPDAPEQVQLNQDIPATSRIPETGNPVVVRTNRTNNAEQDPAQQQQQIENFLAEQTGQPAENFRDIDIETALNLQESFRNRPETAQPDAANQAPESEIATADVNEQQNQEIQQRLQSRLAEQIPNDPGTEFPQLIETVA